MRSLQVFDRSVGNILAAQAGNTTRYKQNLIRQLQQQTNRELCRKNQHHFTDPWIVSYEIYEYIRRVGLCNASFGI